MKRHQDHIKARYKREENVADTNCTPEDKQTVIYEGDVGEPAAHAQEKQETHQQTGEGPINKQKSRGEFLKEGRASKFRHRRWYKQGEIPPKGDKESRLGPADTIRTEEREPQMTELQRSQRVRKAPRRLDL